MFIRWDPAKDRKNQRDHGISFATGAEVFHDPHNEMFENYLVEGEERYATMGWVEGRLLIVFHTYDEENGHESVRIVSARKPTPYERQRYARRKSR